MTDRSCAVAANRVPRRSGGCSFAALRADLHHSEPTDSLTPQRRGASKRRLVRSASLGEHLRAAESSADQCWLSMKHRPSGLRWPHWTLANRLRLSSVWALNCVDPDALQRRRSPLGSLASPPLGGDRHQPAIEAAPALHKSRMTWLLALLVLGGGTVALSAARRSAASPTSRYVTNTCNVRGVSHRLAADPLGRERFDVRTRGSGSSPTRAASLRSWRTRPGPTL